jgi:tetratricopeptide (TPR) repeat protein
MAGETASALIDFDHNQVNIQSAQKWLSEYTTSISDDQIQSDEIARVLIDLCNAYPDAGAYLISFRMGAYERIRWLQAGLQASQRLENLETTQAHLGNLGLAYYELGNFPTAIQYFERALKLAEQIGDQYHQGAWLGDLGNIYAIKGEHKKAIEYHEYHLRIARQIEDERGEGHALANLSIPGIGSSPWRSKG